MLSMSEKRLSMYDTTILINEFIYGGTVYSMWWYRDSS